MADSNWPFKSRISSFLKTAFAKCHIFFLSARSNNFDVRPTTLSNDLTASLQCVRLACNNPELVIPSKSCSWENTSPRISTSFRIRCNSSGKSRIDREKVRSCWDTDDELSSDLSDINAAGNDSKYLRHGSNISIDEYRSCLFVVKLGLETK